jgi:hypothetical protein
MSHSPVPSATAPFLILSGYSDGGQEVLAVTRPDGAKRPR